MTRTKGTYTRTPRSTSSLLSDCMLMWLFHGAEYSSVRSAPPRLYSYYEVTSILQLYDVTNIIYVDSYIITASSACTGHTANMSRTDGNIHNHTLYLCNYLSFLLWENRLNVSGISFIPFLDNIVLCLRLFAFQKRSPRTRTKSKTLRKT